MSFSSTVIKLKIKRIYSTMEELNSKGIFKELLESVKNINICIKSVMYSSVRKKYINCETE